MKIIFLDVDGVLNSRRNVLAFGGFPWPNEPAVLPDGTPNSNAELYLDQIAIGMIRAICEKTGAKIVLHSTWRMHVNPIEWGKKWNLPIIAGTSGNVGKPQSIKIWLSETQRNVEYVSHYAIIDDDDMDDHEHQVTTGITNGFLYEHYQKTLTLLGETTCPQHRT